MKILFILILTCLLGCNLFAQRTDTIHLKDRPDVKGVHIVTDRPPQAVYFGIGGSGITFSANYDRRFSKRLNGLGFAVGAGFYAESGITIFTLPVSINELIGRQNHFLEIAAGATFVTGSVDLFDKSTGSTFIGHINFGYRYQPSRGGFFARAGVSPLFAFESGAGTFTTGYIGLGYCF